MTLSSVPLAPAYAALVGTDRIIVQEQTHGSDRSRVEAFLDREDVQAQMAAMGVSPEEAKARVAALSDDEVSRIAGKIDQLPAGGDFGTILAAIAIVVLILVLTDLLGLTNVFPFTKKGALKP